MRIVESVIIENGCDTEEPEDGTVDAEEVDRAQQDTDQEVSEDEEIPVRRGKRKMTK